MKRKQRSKVEKVTVGNALVKIYTRERTTVTGGKRVVFEVADRTGGRRKLRGFSDHAAARKEAERIARQLSSGNAEAAAMTSSQAASYGRAVELLRPTGAPLEIAAGTYAKCFEILGGDFMVEAAQFLKRHRAHQVQKRRVADVVTELIATKEARGKSPRYIGDLRARLTKFAGSFAVDIGTITTADVQRWLDGLDVGAQTAKNFRSVLNNLFSFAESRGYIFKGGNPVSSTERISADGGEIGIFTPQEIVSLLNAAPKDFLPVVAIGAFAGLRTAEIERIEWRNVDLEGGFIHVGGDKAKTRSRRLVPILPNLAEWLTPYAKKTGKVWTGTPDDLRRARAETVDASGVPWRDNGLRHSFVSYRLASVQNAAQVAMEAGNSADMVFKHYRELVKPADAEKWFAVSPEAPANVVRLEREVAR